MVDFVYVDEVGFNLHVTRQFGRDCRGQRYQWICPTQRDLSLVVAVVVKESLHTMSNLVPTIQTSS